MTTVACLEAARERAIRMLAIDGDARLKGDLIESVILLPEKLFYNTGAPGAIIIFNKNKKHKNGVLFINASSEYEQHPDVRKLNWLSTSNIKKLVDTYKGWKEKRAFLAWFLLMRYARTTTT